jgi:hypothetical protein
MIHVELTSTYQYFFNLHMLSHVSLQTIFFDMVDVNHPDMKNPMPPMPPNIVFPRLPYVLNDHMAWARDYPGPYEDIPVSATIHSS